MSVKKPNFAPMANAMGIKGIRVERPRDLRSAVQEVLILPPKTTLDEAQHFGLFMMKAVLDGRYKELIDLATVGLFR